MEKITTIISWIALVGLFLAALAIIIFDKKKSNNSRAVVYAAVCIAMAYALSFAIVYQMPYGGSITIASFLPLIIYSYKFGWERALVAGVLYGFLQFIQKPYFINLTQFSLDYLLAFMSIAMVGLTAKVIKKQSVALIIGALFTGLARLFFSTLAGIIFYSEVGSRASILPNMISNIDALPAIIYSVTYNGLYILPDIAICLAVLVILTRNKGFLKLVEMEKSHKVTQK